MSNNRRKHPRVRARGIAAHLRGPLGRNACQVENLSIGGLFVRTDQVMDVGTQLEVDLVKPGWKKAVSFFVRVTSRIDPLAGRFAKVTPGMGLQFFGKMDEEHSDRLRAILRELGAPEPAPEEVPLDSTEMELGPIELELGDVDTETPLWQQVQQMVEAENEPLDAETFARPPADVKAGDEVAFPHAIPREKPRPVSHVFQPDPVPATWPGQRPPAPPPARPVEAAPANPPTATAEARLMMQIRGLLLELSDAQQLLSQRETELETLRRELQVTRAALARAVKKP